MASAAVRALSSMFPFLRYLIPSFAYRFYLTHTFTLPSQHEYRRSYLRILHVPGNVSLGQLQPVSFLILPFASQFASFRIDV
jgi:hypothetical protein